MLAVAIASECRALLQSSSVAKTPNAASNIAKLKLSSTQLALRNYEVEIVLRGIRSAGRDNHFNGAPMLCDHFRRKKTYSCDNDYNEPHLWFIHCQNMLQCFQKVQVEFNKRIATIKKVIATKSTKGLMKSRFCLIRRTWILPRSRKNLNSIKLCVRISVYETDPPVNESIFSILPKEISHRRKYLRSHSIGRLKRPNPKFTSAKKQKYFKIGSPKYSHLDVLINISSDHN